MVYVPPTAETFKARYPEFAAVSDTLVNLILADAIAEVGTTWVERDRAKAQMLLAAHWVTMEGEPKRSEAITSGASPAIGMNGPMKRRKVGDVEVEFQNANERFGSQAGASRTAAGYENSEYGRRYLELLRRNFAGPMVV